MSSIETDIREIKESIRALTEKIEGLLHERKTLAMMKLSERSLSAFAPVIGVQLPDDRPEGLPVDQRFEFRELIPEFLDAFVPLVQGKIGE